MKKWLKSDETLEKGLFRWNTIVVLYKLPDILSDLNCVCGAYKIQLWYSLVGTKSI